jgi:hypothetical protein
MVTVYDCLCYFAVSIVITFILLLNTLSFVITTLLWVPPPLQCCLLILSTSCLGVAVAQLVEALRYKPERRGFDSRWCHWNNRFSRTMTLGSTQPLTEMSTRNRSWG